MPGPTRTKGTLLGNRQTRRANRQQQQSRLTNQSRRQLTQIKLRQLHESEARMLYELNKELLASGQKPLAPDAPLTEKESLDFLESVAPQLSEAPEKLVSATRREFSSGRFLGGLSLRKIILILLVLLSSGFGVDAVVSRRPSRRYAQPSLVGKPGRPLTSAQLDTMRREANWEYAERAWAHDHQIAFDKEQATKFPISYGIRKITGQVLGAPENWQCPPGQCRERPQPWNRSR